MCHYSSDFCCCCNWNVFYLRSFDGGGGQESWTFRWSHLYMAPIKFSLINLCHIKLYFHVISDSVIGISVVSIFIFWLYQVGISVQLWFPQFPKCILKVYKMYPKTIQIPKCLLNVSKMSPKSIQNQNVSKNSPTFSQKLSKECPKS